MKKLLFVSVLLITAVFFTACNKEDDRPTDLPATLNDWAADTVSLIAGEGTTPTLNLSLKLSDFKQGTKWGKEWISNVSAIMTSYVEVIGITANDVEMKNVTITGAGKTLTLLTTSGPITTNEKFSADDTDRLAFMQAVMDLIYNTGSADLTLKFTSTNNMLDPKAKLIVRIDSRFTYIQ